jgi:hypothetical protein
MLGTTSFKDQKHSSAEISNFSLALFHLLKVLSFIAGKVYKQWQKMVTLIHIGLILTALMTPESSFMGKLKRLLSKTQALISIIRFVPSFALCILAIVLFSLILTAQLIQTVTKRTWYLLPLVFGCFMEIIGYISRSLSAKKDPYHIIYYVLQYFFIVTAPVFITASMYVCLNKLIAWSARMGYNTARLKPRFILWGFVFCDVVSTIMQVAGAAMIGSAESKRKDPTTPNNILLAGLSFQAFAFLCFIVILSTFVGSLVSDRNFGPRLKGVRPFIIALMAASFFIFLRLIFRLAETAEGVFGYLMVHEAFFGALEFAPVVLAVGILAIWHPGRWIPMTILSSQSSQKDPPMMEGVV